MNKTLLKLFVAAAIGTTAPAWAEDDSFAALSAQWWQWALSIPVASNPLLDPAVPGTTSAVNCMVGQRGAVWFLAGKFLDGGTVRRSCSVPAGVALFFPVINSVNVNSPNICGQGGPLSVRDLRGLVAPFIDAVTVVQAKLDNRPITRIRRVRSEPFITALPIDNLFVAPCGGGVPAGVYSPSVDDGYYVKVNGLAPGMHTLEFRATSGTFTLDVAYELNVVPVSGEVAR